jgi:hypothetical protein
MPYQCTHRGISRKKICIAGYHIVIIQQEKVFDYLISLYRCHSMWNLITTTNEKYTDVEKPRSRW